MNLKATFFYSTNYVHLNRVMLVDETMQKKKKLNQKYQFYGVGKQSIMP